MDKPQAPFLLAAVLCDSVKQRDDGAHDLIGVRNAFEMPAFGEWTGAAVTLYLRFLIPERGPGFRVALQLRAIGVASPPVVELGDMLIEPSGLPVLWRFQSLGNVHIAAPGRYGIGLSVGSGLLTAVPLLLLPHGTMNPQTAH